MDTPFVREQNDERRWRDPKAWRLAVTLYALNIVAAYFLKEWPHRLPDGRSQVIGGVGRRSQACGECDVGNVRI